MRVVHAAGAALAAVVGLALLVADGERGRAQAQATGVLGSVTDVATGFRAKLIGSAPEGTTGDPAEAWGIEFLPPTEQRALLDGLLLPRADGNEQQLALLRYTRADGWRFVQTPVDEEGRTIAAGTGSTEAARVTRRGAIAMLRSDPSRPAARQRILLAAERGAQLRVVPHPGPEVLQPADGGTPAEVLSGRVLGTTDDGDHLVAYVAVEGHERQDAVARWHLGAWTREQICVADTAGTVPDGCAQDETLTGSGEALRSIAIAARGDRAWLLANPASATGRPMVLFERVTGEAGTRWVLRNPTMPGMRPLDSTWALTASDGGVWLDGHADSGGDMTVRIDGGGTTSWCDSGCDHRFGITFAEPRLHRSFAWAPGQRVVAPVPGLGPASEAYATLDGTTFVRRESFNPQPGVGAAFGAPDEGWVGSSRITRDQRPVNVAEWPVPVRRPLTALASAPGAQGAIGTGALAVGTGGTVLRYIPNQGWESEQLLGASGVARDTLRGVAWPTRNFAYAVGDLGAMWRWYSVTGLWEPDPGAPFDFQGHLMGIAFQPGDPNRGYAVGRNGALLRFDKSWVPESLPPEVAGTGPAGGAPDLTSVAFAGGQALVAAGAQVLTNEGAGWHVDSGAAALIAETNGRIYAVAGLPDGGAVAAGRNVVLVRDSAGAPWRYSTQPLNNHTVVAVAALRDGDRVRALASVATPDDLWPASGDSNLPLSDPGQPPPLVPPFSVPSTGILLRETASGWRDEDGAQLRSPTWDNARFQDPTLTTLVDGAGNGWLAGGWTGQATLNGSGRLQGGHETASVRRYSTGAPEAAPSQAASPVPLPPGPARLLVGGNAACEQPCAGMGQLQLMPERTLAHATAQAAALAGQANGPRAFLYTGGRVVADPTGQPLPQSEADRLAELLGGAGGALAVLPAVSPGDVTGTTSEAYQRAFAGAAAPVGGGGPAAGVTPVAIGAAPAPGRGRTHYAADVATGGGTVRVVVIDNADGSLAASDPLQNPAEPQRPWLTAVLDDAHAKRIPAVVMGNRSLDAGEGRAAEDAADVASLLQAHGASAYVYDSPERTASSTIPTGAADGIPSFGSGTLGYRFTLGTANRPGVDVPGLLMLEVDTAKRDPATNRAPVSVRLIPTLEDLVLQAVDGRVLNRSRPALFRGLGRRPRSGDRYVRRAAGPSDPYVDLPNPSCARVGCAGRIDPEVRFSSSDPDIADFVRQDPASDNPRKPFIDTATDKPVADAASGLLCAFNPGTTTVSISSGGLSYSTTVTVRGGSVLRPCGTMPLRNRTPVTPGATAAAPPAPAPAPASSPPPAAAPPPPVPVPPPPAVVPSPNPPAPVAFTPPGSGPPAILASPPPPPPAPPRPIPPSGTSPVQSPGTVVQPAAKVEKQREEEVAPEQQSAAVRYVHGSGNAVPPGAVLALLLAAGLLGAGVRSQSRGHDRGRRLAHAYARTPRHPPLTNHHRKIR